MSPSKKEKKRVRDFIDEIQWLFGIQNYERTITYCDDDKDNLLASVEIEEDYQRFSLYIHPLFWTKSLEDQRKTIIHELAHYIFEPLLVEANRMLDGKYSNKELVRVANERGVSSIENLLNGLLMGRYRYAKEAYKNYLK